MFSINNKNIRDPKTIANKFCQYFSNIGPTFAAKIQNPKKSYQMILKKINILMNLSS